ncbi:hypothetical protein [Methylocapsa acidiphila]|uniref:hypothetical protein n=1 Tax=Methylocapsa acidiphila TaxID=133552 RepID=UPI00040034C5|nr:hypothetical protein [Methylocapsa acidiphila]
MIGLSQASATKRVAISVVALYALLLQGVVGAAARAAAFDRFGSAICEPQGSIPQAPNRESSHQHCFCCISTCSSSSGDAGLLASGLSAFPQRWAIAVAWNAASATPARASERFHFAARGPPIWL